MASPPSSDCDSASESTVKRPATASRSDLTSIHSSWPPHSVKSTRTAFTSPGMKSLCFSSSALSPSPSSAGRSCVSTSRISRLYQRPEISIASTLLPSMLGSPARSLPSVLRFRSFNLNAVSSSASWRTRPAFAAASRGQENLPSLLIRAYSNIILAPSARPALSTVLLSV